MENHWLHCKQIESYFSLLHLNEIAHSLNLILDRVALHQEGVVSVTVDDLVHSSVIALHEDRVLLRLHEGLHSGKCWILGILKTVLIKDSERLY